MGKRLNNRRALILGVSPQNIGTSIARTYLEHGAQVVIAGWRGAEVSR